MAVTSPDSEEHREVAAAGLQQIMNRVHFRLEIDTTNTKPPGRLMNRIESPDSSLVDIRPSTPTLWNDATEELRNMTTEELELPAFVGREITLVGGVGSDDGSEREIGLKHTETTFETEKGFFTVQEMIDNIVQMEKIDRPKTAWFGGLDAHHIFFEGLTTSEGLDSYSVSWGS